MCALISGGCKKSSDINSPQVVAKDSLEVINKWILDSMQHYYYWSSSITSINKLDGDAGTFFKKLINSEDHFSWISNGAEIKAPQTSFIQFGFHYMFISLPEFSSSSLLGVVTLVAPESPATSAGLARGAYFSKVNGVEITTANARQLSALLSQPSPVMLTIVKNENSQWAEAKMVTISKAYFEDKSVMLTKVFQSGSRKTGYIFYNSFNDYTDSYLLAAFKKLHDRNVTELIIDLRYNQGGSVSSAAKFCALICKAAENDLFGIYKGNSSLGNYNQSFIKEIDNSVSSNGKKFSDILNLRLNLNRVFILTGSITASSAEMLINNLKPYINVVQVGDKTLGKDMAGTIIRDLKNPKTIYWYMQPLVFKLFNALNNGGYSTGITPDHTVDEYEKLPLYSIGSTMDPIVKKSLDLIYGNSSISGQVLKDSRMRYLINKKGIHYNSMMSNEPVAPSILNFKR